MPTTIESYIATAREKKQPDEKIKTALVSAGWPEEEITKAFTGTSIDPDLPPPPPPPQPHIGMWTGFLYILFFISLYVLATSIAGLFHDMVDKMIPDIKTTTNYYLGSDNTLVRSAVAAIIVSYPIFTILALILRKQLQKQPYVNNLRSRKLLIYITLIGTFLIMLCHVIFIIYSFLDGKITTNALGHLGVTFLIAGSIFGYFISEVIHDRKS
jgi:amino acid transporter